MRRRPWSFVAIAALVPCFMQPTLWTQAPKREANSSSPARPLAFEIVSIRQNVAGEKAADLLEVTPDGIRMVNMTIGRVILTAYVPESGGALFWEPVGFPPWVYKDRFDIEAKVAELDRAEWQKPAAQTAMLRAMLQTMLADRCGLAIHRQWKDAQVYYLEVGKGGPKFGPRFKLAEPGEAYPAGRKSPFPSGGVVVPEGEALHFSRLR